MPATIGEDRILNADNDTFTGSYLGKDPESLEDVRRVNAKELAQLQNSPAGSHRKLTGWKREPTVMELKKDLESSKSFRDIQVALVQKWEQEKEGGKPIPKRRGKSQVRPKLVRRQAEWRYSALSEPLLSSEDVLQVSPRTYEDAPAASQNAMLVNWQFRTKMDIVRIVNEAVRTFVDEGTLILKPGWRRETITEMVKVPVYEYTQVYEGTPEEQQLQEALQLRESNPAEYEKIAPSIKASITFSEKNGVTAWATEVGSETVPEEKIIANHPTLDVVDYRNIYIDPSCGNDPEKASFIVYSFTTSKMKLAKDGRYKNLNLVSRGSGDPLIETEHGTEIPDDFQFDDEARKNKVAYEYWGLYDINGDGNFQPIVATWIDDQCIRMESNPYPDKKAPFVFAAYSPKKRSVYGEPDAELLSDNQAIAGALTRGMIDLLGRSANSQQGFQKGMLDATNRRRFENGEDYEFNPAANPHQALIEHKYPEIPASAMNMLNMQNYEAEGLTGVKAFAGGLSGENYGEVAAGIKGVVDAAAKREMDILRRLAEAFKAVGIKFISMNQVFLSETEVVRVTNDKFVEIRRDDLQGQFDLKVDISTAEMDERKAADLAFMLQTIGPNFPFKFIQMILNRIAKLRKMPELAQEIITYEPQPDPIEQAKEQLEVKKLELETAETEAKIAEIRAKTTKLISEADSIDLETEIRASGIEHAQDLEKQAAQARGNQDLALTKALANKSPEERGFDVEEVLGLNQLTRTLDDASRQAKPVFENSF